MNLFYEKFKSWYLRGFRRLVSKIEIPLLPAFAKNTDKIVLLKKETNVIKIVLLNSFLHTKQNLSKVWNLFKVLVLNLHLEKTKTQNK